MRNRSSDLLKSLLTAAKKTAKRAHAPYSGYSIGAALVGKDGLIYSGCNVENASYGGTVCAERVAIFKAVSEGAKLPVLDICVYSEAKEPWPPCGFCRQVLAEFATPETRIHLANPKGILKSYTLGELLPEAFTPSHLR